MFIIFAISHTTFTMQKTFVIGDIHGCYDELIALFNKIHLNENDLVISLGDIVDRGNKSKEVYEYLKARPNTVVLMGNHERKHEKGILNYAQEIVKLQMEDAYPDFLQWIATLPYYYETAEAIIVHAALEPHLPLSEQKQEVLAGTTAGDRYLEEKYDRDWGSRYDGHKPVIYGHHVVGDYPEIRKNTYGIDTASCHGGYLTAIELPGFIIHQVKAETDYWKEAQKMWQVPVLKAKDWDNMEITAIRKQLEKLNYIEDEASKAYLDTLMDKLGQLEALYPLIKEKLDQLAQQLLQEHGANFGIVASKYPFKTSLFKSRAGNLSVADISKAFNTPVKIVTLARELELPAQTLNHYETFAALL